MNNLTVRGLVNEIREGLEQKSASKKDEVRVMKELLNDMDYEVGIYGPKEGLMGTMCPAEEARDMITSVISSATKISTSEAQVLAQQYEFKNTEAENMINISKEFVNTYLETGRKLPLGGREHSNVSLIEKEISESVRSYPVKDGFNEDGTQKYRKEQTTIKAHKSIKVESKQPKW